MKKLLYLVFLMILFSSLSLSQSEKELKVWSKYDFVAGDKIIFEDDLVYEQNGEFPSKWDLLYGNAENAKFDDDNVIAFQKNQTKITPLMSIEEYLPEIFTIEFDIYFYGKYVEGYYVQLKNLKEMSIRTDRVAIGDFYGILIKTLQEPDGIILLYLLILDP